MTSYVQHYLGTISIRFCPYGCAHCPAGITRKVYQKTTSYLQADLGSLMPEGNTKLTLPPNPNPTQIMSEYTLLPRTVLINR